MKGKIAPEEDLRAALQLIFKATTHCRNIACHKSTPRKKIEDLMDSINHLPEILIDWERFNLKALHNHLACYDERWSNSEDPFSLQNTWEEGLVNSKKIG